MPKLSTLSVGNYIRNPRRGGLRGDGSTHNILKIVSDEGDSFRCHSLLKRESGVDTIDNENYRFIPKSDNVEQAFP